MDTSCNSKVLRPDVKISLTTEETQLFDLLLKANESAQCKSVLRVAGGWVRDKILGKDSHDIDIAIDNMSGYDFATKISPFLLEHGGSAGHLGRIKANPEKSKHLETTRLMINNVWIDLVNLRAETYDESSRIPTITIGTPKEDAYRRDLTINSMFYNLNIKTIEDFTERGIDDLRNHVIRTPLSPLETFLDDPLRILRCIRFTARFNFTIDPLIEEEGKDPRIRDALVTKVSNERKGIEISTAFHYSPDAALLCMQYLYKFQLLSVLFPYYSSIVKPINRKYNELEPENIFGKKSFLSFYSCEELVPLFNDVDETEASSENNHLYGESGSFSYYYKEGITKMEFIHNLADQLKPVMDVMLPYRSFQESLEDSSTYISYASFFSAFSYLFYNSTTLIKHYLRNELKFKTSVVNSITIICFAAPLLSQIMFESDSFDAVKVGSCINELKDLWPIAFEFSLYDYVYNHREDKNLETITNQYVSFIKQIETHSLTTIWKIPLPIDGKEIMSMGVKGGPSLKYPVQFVQQWHFNHPYGDPSQCKEELKEFIKKNPQLTK